MKRERDQMQEPLSPEVAAVLSALRPVPEPDAAPWEARKRAFLTEARQFATEAISPTPIVRRKTWKDLFSFQYKEGTMAALVKVVVAVALILGMTAGTVSASQESLPGSVLYPVKVQYENVRLATTADGEAKALLALTCAQERVDEAVGLVERGDEIPEPLIARYQQQVGLALQTMEGLGEAQQLQLRAHFSGTLQNQVRVMTQLMARLHQGENAEHPEPTQARIQAMLQTMQQTQQQFGGFGPQAGGNTEPGNEEPGNPDAPGPNSEAPGPNPDANGNGGENGGNGEENGQQCYGDCEGHDGGVKDKHHKNGEDNGGGVSDNGQKNGGEKGGKVDTGNGDGNSDNGGNGVPNDGGGSNSGGTDSGGNGEGGAGNSGEGGNTGGGGNTDGGGNGGDGNGGNGGSGNGNGGGSGGGGGN